MSKQLLITSAKDSLVRCNKTEDKFFYYAHINNQECSTTPYEIQADAIGWAEDETTK